MISPFLLDENGNIVHSLTQWDTNQKLIVTTDGAVTIAPKIHFCNTKSEKALVVQSIISDNKIIADIPNILLEEPYRIAAYIYTKTDISNNSWKTIEVINIPVRKRPKPNDYVYVENVKVVQLSELIKEVQDAIAEFENSIDETLTVKGKAADAKATGDAIQKLNNHLNDISNPHEVTKEQIGLGKVEDKSSSDILGELTSDNVINALGYTPPTQDTTYGVASSSLGLIKAGGDIYVSIDGSVTVFHANSADKINAPVNISLSGEVAGSASFDGSQDVTISTSIESLDASKLTGIISLDNLPKAALERLVIVKNTEARLALTINDIQKGDTVKEEDSGLLYFVVNDSKLDSDEGYVPYTSGSASSVPWSGITGKPDTYTPSVHTHTKSEITDFPTSMPASDVYAWAKQATKPSYTPTEVGVIGTAPISGQVAVFDGTTGKIKSTGFTIASSVPANAKFTDTVYTHPSYTQHTSGLYKITVDGTGHVSAVSPVTADDISSLGIASKSKEYDKTLSASNWIGDTAPYSITLSVTGVTATNNVDVIPQASETDAIEAWKNLGYMKGSQSVGSIIIQAWGEKPSVDIPIKVIVRGDA